MEMIDGVFFPKLPKQKPKDPPDLITLDIWALVSFISVDILLAKTFLILVVCFVVRNNSCGNSSSCQSCSYLILMLFLSYFLLQILIMYLFT